MSDLAWTLGARMPAHDYRIFRTAFVDGEHPRVGKKRFSVIECVDWVNVIALTADERVVLVRQFRVGTGELCLEIPGGMVDPGEDALAAARRELREETGYDGGSWQLIGRVRPNPAIQNNTLYTALAEGVVATGGQELDGSEVIDVETATLAEIREKLVAGTIDHALVVAAFGHLAFRSGPLSR
ncbi:MAG TPA: NUDIX hydrolase [Kofleriaceae bacterium]|nr:NUDIX hydrolase [Kofleriaceae bacterium]